MAGHSAGHAGGEFQVMNISIDVFPAGRAVTYISELSGLMLGR